MTHIVASNIEAEMLIKRLMNFYETFSIESINKIDELSIYSQDIEFVDPVHKLGSLTALKNYFKTMAPNLRHYKIRYIEALIAEETAYLSWEMDFAHRKLNKGEIITLRGISQLKFASQQVYYHEDQYDLGAMLYEHISVIGPVIKHLKKRLSY